MSTTTATKNAGFAMPTGKEILDGAKDLGLIAAGMSAAHIALTAIKKDNWMVNSGLAVAGLGVAVAVKNPIVRMIGLGAAAYGTIKLINSGVKEIATPGTTEGLNGILPEKAKAMIRKFIPTLSGMDEAAGISGLGNADDEFSGLSLDDFGTREESTYSNMSGFGDIEESAAGVGTIADIAA
jgi:hypothetical protein